MQAASQHAFEKFPNISPVLYGENSHMRFSGPLKCIRMKPSGCHPAIHTSGAERILFESMLLFGYRLLFMGISVPKKNQGHLM